LHKTPARQAQII